MQWWGAQLLWVYCIHISGFGSVHPHCSQRIYFTTAWRRTLKSWSVTLVCLKLRALTAWCRRPVEHLDMLVRKDRCCLKLEKSASNESESHGRERCGAYIWMLPKYKIFISYSELFTANQRPISTWQPFWQFLKSRFYWKCLFASIHTDCTK